MELFSIRIRRTFQLVSTVRALLSGHTSPEAKKEVDDFFAAHPDYPVLLSNKIRQQADHLYR